MSTVRFVLRTDKPNKDGTCPIRLIYSIKGKRKYFYPNRNLFSVNWDDKEQKALYLDKKTAKALLPKIAYDLLPSMKEVEEINGNLTLKRKEITTIEDRFQLNGVVYSTDMVMDTLKADKTTTTKTEAPSNQVYDFIDKYIEDNKASRKNGSLSVYKSLKNHLQNFQIAKKKKVNFDAIDYPFFLEFQNYLIGTKSRGAAAGLGNVTIAKILSTLKTFLNYARMHGIEVSDKYKDFKIRKEPLEVIALTNAEFEKLYNYDLSDNKKLGQVRDVFCFSCATGLRYSDLAQLKRYHIIRDEIKLTVTKTKEPLMIPLNPYSQAILAKYLYSHSPLPVISNPNFNKYIKELCKKAELNDIIQIVRFRGPKREDISYHKHELISVHTGRKTFCTLSLEKGMSAEEVMFISGHRDYASFKRYIKITEERSKIVMGKAWGQTINTKLKVV